MASNNVNTQITDAVAQVDLGVIGASPAVAMGMVYQMMATSVGHSMQNATNIQQGMQQVGIATVATACAQIIAQGPGGGGGGGGGGPST